MGLGFSLPNATVPRSPLPCTPTGYQLRAHRMGRRNNRVPRGEGGSWVVRGGSRVCQRALPFERSPSHHSSRYKLLDDKISQLFNFSHLF